MKQLISHATRVIDYIVEDVRINDMYAFAFLKSIPFHFVRDKNSNLRDLVSDAPLRGASSESIRLA